MTTIDLNRVVTFVRVVEAGSFTAAAKRLGVPVSSASRAVGSLESELGVRLLHRTTRKLRLTDGGQLFFQRMQTIIAETEEATRALTGFASEPRGLVRITAPPGLGGQQLPAIIAKLVRRYPELVIELKLTNRVVDLIGEGIDLAIRNGMLEDSSLVARKIANSELGVSLRRTISNGAGTRGALPIWSPASASCTAARAASSHGDYEGPMAKRPLPSPGRSSATT